MQLRKKQQKAKMDPMKRWFITLGLFLLSQLLFVLIDGTILDPKLNNIGDYVVSVFGDTFDWFTLYHSPYLKIVTLVIVLYIVYMLIRDIITLLRK